MARYVPYIIATQSLAYRKFSCTSRADDAIYENISISSTISSPHHPTTIFIHGLDSSKETWSSVIHELISTGYPAIALDMRGHGETSVGPIDEFCTKSISSDILNFIDGLSIKKPVVIVGHSMGGRVAIEILSAEAEAISLGLPRRIASAVIEDIDVRVREGPKPADEELSVELLQQIQLFAPEGKRLWPSWESFVAAYSPWYDLNRIASWKHKRVRQLPSGEWWSDLSPWVQRLSRKRILATEDASLAWDRLAHISPLPFSVHLWVAGKEGTVCSWEGPDGVLDMNRRLPVASVKEFPEASHSIHNSDQKRFLEALKKVIDEAH